MGFWVGHQRGTAFEAVKHGLLGLDNGALMDSRVGGGEGRLQSGSGNKCGFSEIMRPSDLEPNIIIICTRNKLISKETKESQQLGNKSVKDSNGNTNLTGTGLKCQEILLLKFLSKCKPAACTKQI